MNKNEAWKWIEDNQPKLIEISDKIWSYAELALTEVKSSKIIADELELNNFKVERGVAGIPTSFVASWGNGRPVIGILGEYDAMPSGSNKAVPYKEPIVNGAPGHSCGHNIHGVSGMAGAIASKKVLEKTKQKGTIKFFGCPAEENYDGKVLMMRGGVFKGIDACLCHHPGTVNAASLSSSTAYNSVKFHFYGKSSHAGTAPELGRSALDALELMNIGVNFLREHIIQDARIHYNIEEGGRMPNIVHDYARSWYYIRAPEREQVEQIYKKVLKIAEGAAIMTETTYKVEFITACYNKLVNKSLGEIINSNMKEIGSNKYTDEELDFAKKIAATVPKDQKIDFMKKLNIPNWEKYVDIDIMQDVVDLMDEGKIDGGSSDVGDVSWSAPTLEFYTATWVLGTPGHSWQNTAQSGMSIGHKSLIFAAKTTAGSVLDLITEPEFLRKVQDEFKERMRRRTYKLPIPRDTPIPLDLAKAQAEILMKGS